MSGLYFVNWSGRAKSKVHISNCFVKVGLIDPAQSTGNAQITTKLKGMHNACYKSFWSGKRGKWQESCKEAPKMMIWRHSQRNAKIDHIWKHPIFAGLLLKLCASQYLRFNSFRKTEVLSSSNVMLHRMIVSLWCCQDVAMKGMMILLRICHLQKFYKSLLLWLRHQRANQEKQHILNILGRALLNSTAFFNWSRFSKCSSWGWEIFSEVRCRAWYSLIVTLISRRFDIAKGGTRSEDCDDFWEGQTTSFFLDWMGLTLVESYGCFAGRHLRWEIGRKSD